MDQQPNSIAKLSKKLCAVMGDLKEIEKTGWNDFHKYEYLKETDISNTVRPVLAKHNVFIYSSVVEHTRTPIELQGRNGPLLTFITDIRVSYTFVDGDSGEAMSCVFPGTGIDGQDKGLYKALTGAHKYMLLRTFNLGSDEDPEKDESPTKQASSTRPSAPPRATQPKSEVPPKPIPAPSTGAPPNIAEQMGQNIIPDGPLANVKIADAWQYRKMASLELATKFKEQLAKGEKLRPDQAAFYRYGELKGLIT